MYVHACLKEKGGFVSCISHRNSPHNEEEVMYKIAVENYQRPFSLTATWAKEHLL